MILAMSNVDDYIPRVTFDGVSEMAMVLGVELKDVYQWIDEAEHNEESGFYEKIINQDSAHPVKIWIAVRKKYPFTEIEKEL